MSNGISKTKFCKGTDIPKRSGNFSPLRMHFVQQTHPVRKIDGLLIIGDHTPAAAILPAELITLMTTDKFFKEYRREGVYKRGQKEYKCWMEIYRTTLRYDADFTYRESIDSEGDFEYNFRKY